jgi:ribosomal protein S18 acetylase RimI-like enzyme
MKIRRLTISDYEAMTKLWANARLSFKPKGRDSKEAMAAQMRVSPQFFLGAYEGKLLIGTAILSCDLRRGWINRLTVDPNYRDRNIAKTLIAQSEKILRNAGVKIFCALIDDGNVASKELFRKCGYVEHHDIVYFSKRDSAEV